MRDHSFLKFEKFATRNLSHYLPHPVKLKSNDGVLLKIFLCRIEIIFSERRDSILLFRAVLFVIFWGVISSVLLIIITDQTSFLMALNNLYSYIKLNTAQTLFVMAASISAVYWNLSSRYGSQWQYLAELYNNIFIEKVGEKDKFEILYQKTTLCLDLIDLDFWHHKSFSKMFAFILEDALEYCYENYPKEEFGVFKLNRSAFSHVQDIKKGRLDVVSAKLMISRLQNDLEMQIANSEV